MSVAHRSIFIVLCALSTAIACDDSKGDTGAVSDNPNDGGSDTDDPSDGGGDTDDTDDSGPVDQDEDGYDDTVDCDDFDPTTFPGAAPNDSATACMTDADGDGYGSPSPDADVTAGSDCDDDDSATFPGAPDDWYDGVDSDCAGDSDYDADLDGYDRAEEGGGDCDDADALISPDADDTCLDGIDNDCDGVLPTCTLPIGDSAVRMVGTEAEGRAGAAVDAAGDIDGDGVGDLLIGAYGLSTVWVVTGTTDGSVELGSDLGAKLRGSGSMGWAVSGSADVDGDGYADIFAGAPDAGSGDGAVLLIHGPVSGSLDLDASADAILRGAAGVGGGTSLANAGDMDGDGLADLFVGTQGGTDDDSAAYLLTGATTANAALADRGFKLTGTLQSDDRALVAGADLTGDGVHDLAVGDDAADRAWILAGPITADADLATQAYALTDANPNTQAGAALCAGDLDGDGYTDLVVGAPEATPTAIEAGIIYVLAGPIDESRTLDSAVAQLYGQQSRDNAGGALACDGDVDNDGHADLIVGAQRADFTGTNAGAAYMLVGPISGSADLGSAQARLTGEDSSHRAGSDVAWVPDTNGDGFDELLIGGYGQDSNGDRAGGAWLSPGASR